MKYIEMTQEEINEVIKNQKVIPTLSVDCFTNGKVGTFKGIPVRIV